MKMKHKKIAFALLVFGLLFSSCNKKRTAMRVSFSPDAKNRVVGEQILDCLKTKNVDALYDLFSEKTQNDVPNLKQDIKEFYSLYDGEIKTFKKEAMSVDSISRENGKSYLYFTKYSLFIEDIEYILSVKNMQENSFSKKEEGVLTIKLIKKEDEEKYFEYIQYMKPGVFIPPEE